MHITLETDYAVRIVTYLAASAQQRIDAKTISDSTGVTLRFSLKILRNLGAKGIVRSYKGAKGGYELAHSPENLTLYDVLSAVEGPYDLSRCARPDFECPGRTASQQSSCKLSAVYDEISKLVRERLSGVSFAELI